MFNFGFIILRQVLKLAKNPYVLGIFIVIVSLLYHFYSVNNLKGVITTNESVISSLQDDIKTLTQTNESNVNSITQTQKDLSICVTTNDIIHIKHSEQVNSLKSIIAERPRVVYEKSYEYKDCKFEIYQGDANESNETVFSIIKHIGF